MDYVWCIVGGTFGAFFLRRMYVAGTKKALKIFVSILVCILLAGTATRVGRIVLPESLTVSYYIAGVGALLFYFILSPIIQREVSDRYRRISKESRAFAVLIGCGSIILVVSIVMFFVQMFVDVSIPSDVLRVILLPIRFLWLFPYW